jgi:uncharacterized protein
VSHQLLFYDYVEDVLERRGPYRAAHLDHARRWHGKGRLLQAGALGDPVRGAVFTFASTEPAEVERYAREDPYVVEGLVTAWRVEPWNVVVGGGH